MENTPPPPQCCPVLLELSVSVIVLKSIASKLNGNISNVLVVIQSGKEAQACANASHGETELVPVSCSSNEDVLEDDRDGTVGIIGRTCRAINITASEITSDSFKTKWPLHRIVDLASRVVFPLLFLVANIVYFMEYLGGRKNLR